MINHKILEALSSQVGAEYYSAYLYLAMSAWCDVEGFKGFANWMHVQAREETAHGTHLYEYILERGATPQFAQIKAPPQEFGGLREIFAQALRHEQSISERINQIATLAMGEGDHATYTFIQWYVTEQVEEESSAELILQKLTLISDNLSLIYTLDAELSARLFIDPFAV